jgi:peptidoglycan hydrolase-like protein with peptidoglycan-binding domain
MTTTTTTTPAATSTPSNNGSGNRGRGVALALAGVLVGAAVATGLVYGLGAGTAAPTVPSSSVVVDGGGSGSSTHHHVTPVNPPVKPSAAIETLQRELGQLNYYEGPVTGLLNAQTTQAITYLQRDAHLPQTGTMNAATQAALANFLAHGNNQMGS